MEILHHTVHEMVHYVQSLTSERDPHMHAAHDRKLDHTMINTQSSFGPQTALCETLKTNTPHTTTGRTV